MPTLTDVLWGILFPSLMGFGAGLLATCRGRSKGDGISAAAPRWRAALGVLLLGIAISAPWWALWQWKGWWPASLFDRQALIIFVFGVVLSVAAMVPKALASALIIAEGPLVLVPLAQRTGAWFEYGLAGIALGVIALVAERAVRGRNPVTALGTLVFWLALVAPALVLMASAKQGQAVGFIAAGLGGIWGASWFTRTSAPGAAALAVLASGLLLSLDQRYGDKPDTLALLLMGIAPLGLLLRSVPGWHRRPWTGVALGFIAVVLLAGIGLGLAAWQPRADAGGAPPAPAVDDYSTFGR